MAYDQSVVDAYTSASNSQLRTNNFLVELLNVLLLNKVLTKRQYNSLVKKLK
jgi:hypothetical protein